MPFESSKVKSARDKHAATCKIIDEDGLFDLIRASAPQLEPVPSNAPPATASSSFHVAVERSEALPSLPSAEGAEPLWAEKYRPSDINHLV